MGEVLPRARLRHRVGAGRAGRRRGRLEASAVERYPHGQITPGSRGRPRRPVRLRSPLVRPAGPQRLVGGGAVAVRSAARRHSPVAGIGLDFTSCTMLPARGDGTPLVDGRLLRRAEHRTCGPSSGSTTARSSRPSASPRLALGPGEPWLDRYGGTIGARVVLPEDPRGRSTSDPEVADAAEVWLEAGDWVVWQLTGAPSLGGRLERRATWSARRARPATRRCGRALTATRRPSTSPPSIPALGDVRGQEAPRPVRWRRASGPGCSRPRPPRCSACRRACRCRPPSSTPTPACPAPASPSRAPSCSCSAPAAATW